MCKYEGHKGCPNSPSFLDNQQEPLVTEPTVTADTLPVTEPLSRCQYWSTTGGLVSRRPGEIDGNIFLQGCIFVLNHFNPKVNHCIVSFQGRSSSMDSSV